ncbi:MAG: PAN domain-containing protein [Ancalomicrobiaceae bacterium]|nr:PAN domain-containing protein [Ancalomicrobiaceae bacterium]
MNSRSYPFALARGTDISGYVVERVLGAGGFGITYAATNPVTGITVAVKEFFPQGFASREGNEVLLHSDVSSGSYEQALKKFEQEAAKLTARYQHPNIVRGINFLRANNTCYFIMEFISGVSLDDWLLGRTTPPSEAELRPIFEEVLDAVDYIHGRDGMHRDLTPRNIMVRGDGSAVLVDFGASGEGLDTDRGHSAAFAQPNYAPPEQLAGEDSRLQGRHTDIFSIGGVLYRAISDHPPVKPLKRSHEVAMAGPPADPYVPARAAALYPERYSAAFFAGIDAALRLDYRQRPATITELRRMLGWLDQPTDAVSQREILSTQAIPPPPFGPPPPVPPVRPDVAPVDTMDARVYGYDRPPGLTAPDFDGVHGDEYDHGVDLRPRHRYGVLLATVAVAVVMAVALLATFNPALVHRLFGGSGPAVVEAGKSPATEIPVVTVEKQPREAGKDQPKEAPKPPVKEAIPAPPKEAPKEPVKEAIPAPPALPLPPTVPAKPPVPKVDFADLGSYSAAGKELALPSPAPTTPDACRTACAEDQQCRGFTVGGNVCSLYGDITSLSPDPDRKLTLRSDWTGLKALRQGIDTESRRRYTFRHIDGVTLASASPTARTVANQEQCRFACLSDQSCKAYSFTGSVGACLLHKQVVPQAAKPAVGFITEVDDADGQLSEQIRRAMLAKTRTFKGYTGIEFTAASARRSAATDPGQCRQSCTEDQTCVAASFADGECSRFSDVEAIRARPGAEAVADVADAKLAERIEEAATKREAKGDAEIFPGFDVIGNAVANDRARTAQSLDDCQAICRDTNGCTAFSFVHADGRCLLATAVSDTIPDPARTAGLFKGPAAPVIDQAKRRIQASDAQRPNFRDMPGSCAPQGASSILPLQPQALPEQCAFMCRSGSNCQGWVFSRNDLSCSLISSITGTTSSPGLVSGVYDPSGRRVAELTRSCGPVPPAALTGGTATDCDREAGFAFDPELPKGIEPKPFELIDPSRAVPVCQRAADNSPSSLRIHMELGRAFERDGRMNEARIAYKEAADQGNAPAAYLYGMMVNRGVGGPQDDAEAERYFKLARTRGVAPAATALGLLYAGSDRPAGPGEADTLRLLEEAAQRGQGTAMYRLGEAYEKGRINRRPVVADPAQAQAWYGRALDAFRHDVERKDVTAYKYLSLIYDGGRGVPRDPVQALDYLVTYLSEIYGPDNIVAHSRGTVGELHLDEWSLETRKAFQAYLRDRGLFQDPIDGTIGGHTIEAIDRWLGMKG